MSEPSDAALVDAINGGDTAAFETLYVRYREWVVDLAWRLTGDRELALDVMQDVFVYLLGKFPGFELRSKMKTFLYPAVRHTAIARQSRAGRRPGSAAMRTTTAVGTPYADEEETRHQLARLVEELPPGQREVLLLRFVDDLSLDDIAEAIQIPTGTVKSRLHHALGRLREDPFAKNLFDA